MYVNAAVGRGAKMTLEPALDGVLTLIHRPLRFHPESPIPPSSPAQSHFSSARPCLCCWRGHRINVGVCMHGRCFCRPPVTTSVTTTPSSPISRVRCVHILHVDPDHDIYTSQPLLLRHALAAPGASVCHLAIENSSSAGHNPGLGLADRDDTPP